MLIFLKWFWALTGVAVGIQYAVWGLREFIALWFGGIMPIIDPFWIGLALTLAAMRTFELAVSEIRNLV